MNSRELAINGGKPVRDSFLPYSRQIIDEEDQAAVIAVLKSDYLTTGPAVEAFEMNLSAASGNGFAAAVSNGTAALHCMVNAYNIGPGDEVIVPAITFAATANAVRYQGATPVFADIDSQTLLIDPASVERLVTSRTKAVIAVDFAGQPADYDSIRSAVPARVHMLADAAHSIGASLDGVEAGALADASTFSFHPVKPVAAGEGGAVVSQDSDVIASVKRFRNHGINLDQAARAKGNTWKYEMQELGFNYRMPDILCALASSQLKKLEARRAIREKLSYRYNRLLSGVPGITPLVVREGAISSHHLHVVKIDPDVFGVSRDEAFVALRAENIGVNVHYIPVPLHPYYRESGASGGPWPEAMTAYEQILTLPLWSGMTDDDVDDVVSALKKIAAV